MTDLPATGFGRREATGDFNDVLGEIRVQSGEPMRCA